MAQVLIQTAAFDVGAALAAFKGTRKDVGATAVFIGTLRDLNEGLAVTDLTLEHYPGMTESMLHDILAQAQRKFDILDAMVIHRVGKIRLAEDIVMVAVQSAHRGAAFAACEFIMDFLKTQAPFWKKETVQGLDAETHSHWIEAKHSDDAAAARWV